jgi:hypothetical protein
MVYGCLHCRLPNDIYEDFCMRLSLLRFYWLRIFGALLALIFSLFYLLGLEGAAAAGFSVMALAITVLAIRIRNNTLPASCDLCGGPATITTEYGAGFANARLILNCPRCGRVINGRPGSMQPQKE